MTNHIIGISLALGTLTVSTYAATMNVNSFYSSAFGIADSNNTALALGSEIRLGTFSTLTDSQIESASFINLEDDFIHFSLTDETSSIGSGASFETPGYFDFSIHATPPAIGGDSVFIWVFNDDNTEHAIFKYNSREFVRQDDIPNILSIGFDGDEDISQLVGGGFDDALDLGSGGGTFLTIATDSVPEPSSTALLGLGTVGFLLRRRRQA